MLRFKSAGSLTSRSSFSSFSKITAAMIVYPREAVPRLHIAPCKRRRFLSPVKLSLVNIGSHHIAIWHVCTGISFTTYNHIVSFWATGRPREGERVFLYDLVRLRILLLQTPQVMSMVKAALLLAFDASLQHSLFDCSYRVLCCRR